MERIKNFFINIFYFFIKIISKILYSIFVLVLFALLSVCITSFVYMLGFFVFKLIEYAVFIFQLEEIAEITVNPIILFLGSLSGLAILLTIAYLILKKLKRI